MHDPEAAQAWPGSPCWHNSILVHTDMMNWHGVESAMTVTTPERGIADDRSRRQMDTPAIDSEAARRELVRRIVRSPTFARSERLGTLLTYVCNMAFQGREAEINEQKIGEEVFGRLRDYDSAVDGIVRSQASRLRQRLGLYFQQEGAEEPLRIVIPRGGYVPFFETQGSSPPLQSVADPAEAIAESIPSASAQATNLRQWLPWGVSLVLVMMLVALWVHDRRRQTPTASASQAHPFWSQVFLKNQPTMVVAPDSGLVLYHGMSGKGVDLKDYLDGGYRAELNGPPHVSPVSSQKDWLIDLANRRYTSIVDLNAILRLKDRAQTLGSDVSVRYARDLRPNDLKTGNVVLLGMSSANPWVELFENDMNFVLEDDFTKSVGVMNRSPQNGEPARWQILRTDPERPVFGVVAYLPNLARDGNDLIIEGISMAGTEAAMDFLDDDAKLLPFLNRIRRPDGSLPHFEVLLESHNMGASAVQTQILAWRTRK